MSSSSLVADPAAARAAAEAVALGECVVLAESRFDEAEGNLMFAAEFVTADEIGFLSSKSLGVTRLCLTDERCAELGLDAFVASEHDWQPTAAIAHRSASGPGASISDRATTIRAAIDPASVRADFVPGGYVFPLRARPGGVLRRGGRTEAAIDLARLAGCLPAATLSLVMNVDGTVARGAQLPAYAEANGYSFVTVGDVIALRRLSEKLVKRVTSARIPTPHGEFTAVGFVEELTGAHHVAFIKGDLTDSTDTLVRVHTECLSGDVFHTTSCDCGRNLVHSLELIESEGCGVLVYLVSPEGERRLDRHSGGPREQESAPMGEYGIGGQILADLGLRTIRVLTDHPRPIPALEGFGLQVSGHVPLRS